MLVLHDTTCRLVTSCHSFGLKRVLGQVYKESSKRAIDEQFGGEDETPPPAPGFTAPTLKLTKYSNAYMLVYVRQSSWKDIMLEVGQNDIAEHVCSRLEVGLPWSPFNLLCRVAVLFSPVCGGAYLHDRSHSTHAF